MRSRNRGRFSARGVTMVEFALVAPLALLLMYLVLELGRAGYDYNQMASAAREGARAAIAAQESSKTVTQIQADVLAAVNRGLGGIIAVDPAGVRDGSSPCPYRAGYAEVCMLPYSSPPGGSQNPTVTIKVTYGFTPFVTPISRLLGSEVNLDSSTTEKTEY